MIRVDAYFTNGNVHKTCQDYALYGEDPLPYVIICDGCSSSRFTDIGARLIALSAKKVLLSSLKDMEFEDITDDFFYDFKSNMLHEMSVALRVLEIPTECMDSTLIVSFIKDRIIHTICYGDGQRLIIFKDNNYWIKTISFDGNAPYYLAYQMGINYERNRIFKNYAKSKDNYLTRYVEVDLCGNIEKIPTKFDDFMIDQMPIKDIKSYLVMSDGTESFVNRETGERIHYQQILNEFSSFKNTNGEFIKRRVGRAIEDLVKTNIYNTDDISVAGFYFSEEE